MQKTPVLLALLLVLPVALGASELRIRSIEPQNQQNQLQTAVSVSELKQIRVKIKNIGDAACTQASVELDIQPNDQITSLLPSTPLSAPQTINSQAEQIVTFVQNTDFTFVSVPQPDVYRIAATAICNSATDHNRSALFTIVSDEQVAVPETHVPIALVVVLLGALFFGFGRKKTKTQG